MTETKKEKKPKADVAPVEAALRHYDRCLWGRRATLTEARALLESVGVKTDGLYIGVIARRVCQFYEQLFGGRFPTRRASYESSEWFNIQRWLREHDADIDAELDTVQSVTRRMLYDGILVSPTAVREVLPERLKGLRLDEPLRNWFDLKVLANAINGGTAEPGGGGGGMRGRRAGRCGRRRRTWRRRRGRFVRRDVRPVRSRRDVSLSAAV